MSNQEDGLRTINVPPGSSIAEFLGHQFDGDVHSTRRFARSAVLGTIEANISTLKTRVDSLSGSQFPGFVVFDTKASMNANLNFPANTGATVYADTPANNGIYQKSGASGAGLWVYLGPLQNKLSDKDFNTLASSKSIISVGTAPVIQSGIPSQFPDAIASTFAGWATPVQAAGQTIDTARFWYNIEEPGHTIRCSVWKGSDKTLLAQTDVQVYETQGFIDLRFTPFNLGSQVVYVSMHVPSGLTRLRGYTPLDYTDVADTTTYPQKYMTTSSPSELLTGWSSAVGGTGFPIAFALYNSEDALYGRPLPDDVIMTPRHYGIAGLESNIYLGSIRSGRSQRVWNVDSTGGNGKQQDERWTFVPGGSVSNDTLSLEVYDPDTVRRLGGARIRYDAVAMNAAAGASRRVLIIGDSLTAHARYQKQFNDLQVANASAAQATFMGTLTGDVATGGSISDSALKHEGRGGWAMSSYYQPTGSGIVDNPFTDHVAGHKFDASYYLSSTSQTRPDLVVWELGINDMTGAVSDKTAHASASSYLQQLDEMIGLVAAADVGSWAEVDASIKHLIFVPTTPALSQDAFGKNYGVGLARARYFRSITILQWRIIEHYRDKEGNGIFLAGMNAVVDPIYGFPFDAAAPANSQTTTTIVRQNNAVHPYTTGIGGYEQMGDAFFAAYNYLVAAAKI